MKRLFALLLAICNIAYPLDSSMWDSSYYIYPSIVMENIAAGPTYSTTSFVIDAANEKGGVVYQAPKTGSVTHIWWRTGVVTTGATVNVRIETVGATGDPTGTPCGTQGTQVVADTDDNVDFFTPLGANCSVTRGTVYAILIENPAASFGNMQIVGNSDRLAYFPYGLSYTTGYGKGAVSVMAAMRYSDGTYGYVPGIDLFDSITSRTYNNGSTPDIWGNRFKFKTKKRVYGAYLHGDFDGDFTVKIISSTYADGGGALASYAYDADYEGGATGLNSYVIFDQSVDIEPDTYYRIVVEPTTATNTTVYSVGYSSAPLSNAAPDAVEYHLTSSKTPSGDASWTNYNNETDGYGLALIGLIIEGEWIPEFSHTSAN